MFLDHQPSIQLVVCFSINLLLLHFAFTKFDLLLGGVFFFPFFLWLSTPIHQWRMFTVKLQSELPFALLPAGAAEASAGI